MTLQLLGRVWRLLWVKRLGRNTAGECESPDTPKKVIRILKDLEPENELRLVLHECLHACAWWLDEEWIDSASRDLARVLWRLGWRKVENPK
jgi:hypothetical protein